MRLYFKRKKNKKKKLTVFEHFAGVGAQAEALKCANVNFESVGISEIDPKAIIAYEALHGKANNFGDISKIESIPYADLWTYSFPCTDISTNGKQDGMIDGKTHSGLIYEVGRHLKVSKDNGTLPKFLLMENVKNLVNKKFRKDFDAWLERLSNLGYNNYWMVINATSVGIPQNRERVFVVSIRKDVDKGTFSFNFTKKFPNNTLVDFLEIESDVDEKFYLNEEKLSRFVLDTKAFDSGKNVVGKVYSKNGRCFGTSGKVFGKHSIIGTLCRSNYSTSAKKVFLGYDDDGNPIVRCITPKEATRLMGFTDEDYKKLCDVNLSRDDIYKLMGNSIVVNVLEEIFRNLLSDYIYDDVSNDTSDSVDEEIDTTITILMPISSNVTVTSILDVNLPIIILNLLGGDYCMGYY